MNATDLTALLPLLVMGGTILAVMLATAIFRRPGPVAVLAVLGAVLALAALWPARAVAPRQVTPLLVVDFYAIFFMGLILAASILVLLLAHGYLGRRGDPPEAFHLLVLLATLGAMAVVASDHFAAFFLGLETISIALIGLIAYPRAHGKPLEAGIKYLILAGFSSALLLFGIALVYLRLGTMAFPRIAASRAPGDVGWLAALALIFAGFGFKLSIVPFHMWAPDVYQGAPAPVTGFIAVVSKAALFALLLRWFAATGAEAAAMIQAAAIASMLAGNLLALLQTDVKRILAYSSIAHIGYLLLPLLAGGALGLEAVAYYLGAYSVMTLGAFGIVTVLSAGEDGDDASALECYRGLAWRRPFLAAGFTLMLLSLAGLPPTMGFFAKFYALAAGISGRWWPAVAALVAGSAIGLVYYLRIIVVMVQPAPALQAPPGPAPWLGMAVIGALAAVLIWLGVDPAPLVGILHTLRVG